MTPNHVTAVLLSLLLPQNNPETGPQEYTILQSSEKAFIALHGMMCQLCLAGHG